MTENDELRLIRELTATAELMGATLTGQALAIMAEDLSGTEVDLILHALAKLRRTNKKFTLASILELIGEADGRPSVDQAWAMMPKSEDDTGVITQEVIDAWSVACDLYCDGDKTGAHIAFQREYVRVVAEARDRNAPVRWFSSLGFSKAGRTWPLKDAVLQGRLAVKDAIACLDDDGRIEVVRAAAVAGLLTDEQKHTLLPPPPGKPEKVIQFSGKRSGMKDFSSHIEQLRLALSGDEQDGPETSGEDRLDQRTGEEGK